VHPAPPQFDAGVKFDWRDQIWLGATYRHDDAVSFMGGFAYKDFLLVAYSYDMATSNLRDYSDGTHELMVGVRFRPWKKVATEDASSAPAGDEE
jgi:hypothetical protein